MHTLFLNSFLYQGITYTRITGKINGFHRMRATRYNKAIVN